MTLPPVEAKVAARMPEGPSPFTRFLEQESLRPDLKRAVRMTIAFMVPLTLATLGPVKFGPVHICLAAQTIAMVDVRGAYAFRFAMLAGISLVLAAAVALASLAGVSVAGILAGTILVVAAGGLWRHLSSELGPGLAISSGLMFLLTAAENLAGAAPHHAALLTLGGAFFGVLLQVAAWPIQPQHPLRKTVAESWLALADLLAAMPVETPARAQSLADLEAAMRTTLNRTQANLNAMSGKRGTLPKRLEAVNLIAARLAMRTMVLNTALDTHAGTLEISRSMFDPLLESLGNLARSVATCVVSRQASHLAAIEVRLTRIQGLISVLQARIHSEVSSGDLQSELIEITGHIAAQLPGIGSELNELTSHADERTSASLELTDLRLMRPLAFELSPFRKPEPALVRHTIRITCMALLGVLAMLFVQLHDGSRLPHGYWIPFTMLVVLQPDYGSTRQRAAQRMLGTLAGGLLASTLLWVQPPVWVILVTTAISIAIFGYFVKKNYGIAVIFITLMVALLTEASHPVTLAFTLERSGSTLAGGMIALVAALVFWPVWEASRFPGIMATALERNVSYLQIVFQRLIDGGPYDSPLMDAKREAESANSEVFSSIKRMNGDPRNRRKGLEQAATLANGNQRITRALNVIAIHLNDQKSRNPQEIGHLAVLCETGFQALIEVERSGATSPALSPSLEGLQAFRLPTLPPDHGDPARFREPWVYPQLGRIITELSAMILSVQANRADQSIAEPPSRA